MTRIQQEMLVVLGESVGIQVTPHGDGSVSYGKTRTYDVDAAGAELLTLRTVNVK